MSFRWNRACEIIRARLQKKNKNDVALVAIVLEVSPLSCMVMDREDDKGDSPFSLFFFFI